MGDWYRIGLELKAWQESAAALIGFGALAWSVSHAAKASRTRDKAAHAAEAKAVAVALYSEIVGMRRDVASLAEAAAYRFWADRRGSQRSSFDQAFLDFHPMPAAVVYPALASRLGTLEASLAIAIVNFHKSYEEARHWRTTILPQDGRPYEYSINALLAPALAAVIDIEPVLRKIEAIAGGKEEPRPQVKEAITVRDYEDERNEAPVTP